MKLPHALRDEQMKPSTTRMLLWLWTLLGLAMIVVEMYARLDLRIQTQAIGNAVWHAWETAEGFFTVAVFGPRVGQYLSGWFSGGLASVATATRDPIVVARRDAAAKAGSGGTEYTP